MDSKFACWSKTIVGVVVMLVTAGSMVGIEISQEESVSIQNGVQALFLLVGSVLAIVGRVTASGGIHFNPFKGR